jgi:hypothetical protein
MKMRSVTVLLVSPGEKPAAGSIRNDHGLFLERRGMMPRLGRVEKNLPPSVKGVTFAQIGVFPKARRTAPLQQFSGIPTD